MQKFGKCRLCQQDRQLRNSHIIPEWCYTSVYDGPKGTDHQFIQLSTVAPPSKPIQKGLREYLLCPDCELKRSKWEAYVREIFYANEKSPFALRAEQVGQTKYTFTILGLDYAKFKLFQMSVLWMSAITTLHQFSPVRLGKYEEELRAMLHANDPGEPERFPCMMSILLGEDGKPFDRIIQAPEALRYEGHRSYRFLFSFAMWRFIVSRHFGIGDTAGIIVENGKLTMIKAPLWRTPLGRGLIQFRTKLNKRFGVGSRSIGRQQRWKVESFSERHGFRHLLFSKRTSTRFLFGEREWVASPSRDMLLLLPISSGRDGSQRH